MCSIHLDDATAAICTRTPTTPAYWWRGDRVMKPISVWGWLGGHDDQRPVGKFGQDAGVTPLLFFEGHAGIFMTTESQDLGFNVSSECLPTEPPLGSARLYLNSVLQTYVPSRSLRWTIVFIGLNYCTIPKRLKIPFNDLYTVPIWRYNLPNSSRAAESLPIFKKRLETHLFHLYLTL